VQQAPRGKGERLTGDRPCREAWGDPVAAWALAPPAPQRAEGHSEENAAGEPELADQDRSGEVTQLG
jgi:hypothetical protein